MKKGCTAKFYVLYKSKVLLSNCRRNGIFHIGWIFSKVTEELLKLQKIIYANHNRSSKEWTGRIWDIKDGWDLIQINTVDENLDESRSRNTRILVVIKVSSVLIYSESSHGDSDWAPLLSSPVFYLVRDSFQALCSGIGSQEDTVHSESVGKVLVSVIFPFYKSK